MKLFKSAYVLIVAGMFFLLSAANPVFSQIGWFGQNSGTTAWLYSVHFIDATTGWVVGDNGTILKTTDSGTSWVTQNGGTAATLHSVYFTDANTGWAVGFMDYVLKTNDGGATWTQVHNGGIPLYSVHFIDAKTGWAVGSNGAIRKTTDGGTTWVFGGSGPSSFHLRSVYFFDVNTGWVVGDGGTRLKTTNGGITWETQHFGGSQQSVYFINANTGWTVADDGSVFKTTDGGTTWVLRSSGTTKPLDSVHFIDANIGWTVGDGGTILKTTDGGANWVVQNSKTSARLRSVHFIDGNIGWTVGNGGTILKTINGGLPVPCDVLDVSPTSQAFEPNGGTGSVAVSTLEGCGWMATSNVEWIHITSGTSGYGPGTIQYSVDVNYGNVPRNAAISVTGSISLPQTVTVSQSYAAARPRITSVVAQFDGNSDPNIFGFYIPSIELLNTFIASAFDPDGTTAISVRFRLLSHNGQLLTESTDSAGSDGWQATFNMKDLTGTSPVRLEVQALDASGFHSEPQYFNVEFMSPLPEWIDWGLNNGLLSAYFDPGANAYQFNLENTVFTIYDESISESVPVLGGLRNRIALETHTQVDYSIGRNIDFAEYKAGIGLILLDLPIDLSKKFALNFSHDLYDPTVTLILPLRYKVIEASIGYGIPKVARVEAAVLVFARLTLNVIVDANKLDPLISNGFTMKQGTFADLGLDVEAGIYGKVDLGVVSGTAKAFSSTSASVRIGFYQKQTGDIVFETPKFIDGGLVLGVEVSGCIGKSFFKKCGVFYSKSITVFDCIFCGKSSEMLSLNISHSSHSTGTELYRPDLPPNYLSSSNRGAMIPEVLQTPAFASSDAQPIMVWMHDDDTTMTKPQVYFAAWSENRISNPQPITTGDFLRMDPAIAKLDSNTAMFAWTQNLGQRGEEYTSTEILANQEIFVATGNIKNGTWSNPINLSQNTFADGKVQLAGSGGGSVLAAWTHQASLAQDFNPLTWDITYSFYQKNTNSWSTPQAIPDAIGADFGVKLTYGRNNYVAVWLHDEDGDLSSEADQEIQTASFDYQNMKWSQRQTISRSQYYKRDHTVAITNLGRPIAIWREDEMQPDSSFVSKIFYSTANFALSEWSVPRLAYGTKLQIDELNLAMLPQGADEPMAISWREMLDVGGEVMVSFARLGNSNSAWTKPDTLTSDSLLTWLSTMSIDNNNNLIVTYAKTIFGDSLTTTIPTDLGNYADNLDVIARGIAPDLTLLSYLNTQPTMHLPTEYMLKQNYPNPFNLGTEIRFALPEDNHVVLKIFNTVGQEIRTLVDAKYRAGYYSIRWDGKDNNGKDAASGVYIYQWRAGDHIESRAMTLIK